MKNAVTRAVGVYESVEVDTLDFDVIPGDRFLLCTDGLTEYAQEADILRIFSEVPEDKVAQAFIDHANQGGGKDNITALVVKLPDATSGLDRLASEVNLKLETLHRMPLFRHLTYQEVVRVMNIVDVRTYAAEQRVLEEGDAGDEMFIVLTGRVRVHSGDANIAQLGPGQHFGEMALVDKVPRSASVTSEEPSQIDGPAAPRLLRSRAQGPRRRGQAAVGVPGRPDRASASHLARPERRARPDRAVAVQRDAATRRHRRGRPRGSGLRVSEGGSNRRAICRRSVFARVQIVVSRRPLGSMSLRVSRRCAFALLGACGMMCIQSPVAADDTKSVLMAQPLGYTDVADAFEPDDLVDVDVRLSYARESTSGTVQREIVDDTSGDGRTSAHRVDVADHSLVRNVLALGLDVGVYHDVMVFLNMPIVLGEDSELRPMASGCLPASTEPGCLALLEPIPDDVPTPLIALDRPLRSARRSGLRSIDFGVAWGVTNQYRVPHLPTWVLRMQGEVSTGRTMHACLEGQTCDPGIGRGTASIRIESRWSYRYRVVEPFLGIAYTYEWVSDGDAVFYPGGKFAGIVDPGPPSITQLTAGAGVFPWEDRARHQRFEIDVRGQAALISGGRDYTPLFDALGSSANPHLSEPNYEQVTSAGPHAPIAFTGITSVQGHARLSLATSLVMQAARYVRFALGIGVSGLTSHLITGALPCNAAASVDEGDARRGLCQTGLANPAYRPAIDLPGRRFRLDGAISLQLSAMATGQF